MKKKHSSYSLHRLCSVQNGLMRGLRLFFVETAFTLALSKAEFFHMYKAFFEPLTKLNSSVSVFDIVPVCSGEKNADSGKENEMDLTPLKEKLSLTELELSMLT